MLLALISLAEASDVLGEVSHVELEVGFLVGGRTLGAAPFARVEGEDGRPLAGLDAPFARYPLADALVLGPRAEVRWVAPPLRVGLGWQRPYPDWEVVDEHREPDGAGDPVIASVRALRTDELRLALGLEAPTGLVVPFLELVGDLHVSSVALEVDGVPATFRSESFSLGPRAGLRAQVSDGAFVQLAGEVMPLGPFSWGGSLGLGAAIR